jgi:MYXO-CTERM domain-containing protein
MSRWAAISLLLVGAACSRSSSGSRALAESPIVAGALDTTHAAVVTVLSENDVDVSSCSGTIVKSDLDDELAWVVTAAHCVDSLSPVNVLFGDDATLPLEKFDVVDFAADPRYDHQPGSPYDFAVVRIDAGRDLPVIPLVDGADELTQGTVVTSVGYGRTTTDADAMADDGNQRRHSVVKTLDSVTDTLVGFDMATSGFCTGDSGGPLLVGDGDTLHVVAIQSYVHGSCTGTGFSGRVSAGAAFFAAQLARGRDAPSVGTCSAPCGNDSPDAGASDPVPDAGTPDASPAHRRPSGSSLATSASASAPLPADPTENEDDVRVPGRKGCASSPAPAGADWPSAGLAALAVVLVARRRPRRR